MNNINSSDCTFLSKNSIIYYIKSKYFLFISIAQYMSYGPVYFKTFKHEHMPSLYYRYKYVDILSSLTIDDFTKQYIH